MRRITRVTLAVAASGVCSICIGVGASAQAANAGKVLLCHGTASESNPYVLISVSETGTVATRLDGHGQESHPDFLLPAGRATARRPSLEDRDRVTRRRRAPLVRGNGPSYAGARRSRTSLNRAYSSPPPDVLVWRHR